MTWACGDGISTGSPALSATPSPISTLPPPTASANLPPTQTIPAETTARQLRVFAQLWQTVHDTYVYPDFNGLDWDEVYRRYRARIEVGLEDQAFYRAMREMINKLGDDHSTFNSPQEVAEEAQRVSGQFDYIGIGIYVTTLFDQGYAVLLQVFPGSSAQQAGLMPHDRILAVDGLPVIDEHTNDRLDLLEGPVGSEVRVTVQTPGQEPREIVVKRAHIQAQLLVEAYRLPGTDIGYILVPSFWDCTVAGRVRQSLADLMVGAELRGLIVDMRINGGGLDKVLRDTLSIFTQGELGTFVSRTAERPLVIEANPVGNSQELPLALLVGQETESFGEIFCGVLKESRQVLVVGRTTAGNVETLWQVDFEDGSRAWIASETFRPPSGADWEGKGIVPDVEIPLNWDEFTSQNDPQLQAALERLLQLLDDEF
jgi:carboxyl-terminal processing protease